MADSPASPSTFTAPTPALHSTADEAPYVPVSWLAVAAAATASLLAFLLLLMGLLAFRSRRPLLEEELFIPLAVVAIVLSFAARRVIRNSEGTRTGSLFGIDLPNAAWWAGLVLGLGYCSYLFAIGFSVEREAKGEVQTWTDLILKGDNESLNRAFHRTQEPSQRKGISPTEGTMLEGRWGKEYVAFRQCDVVRLFARNKENKLEVGGLHKWDPKPAGVECTVAATVTNPEGTFPLQIPLRGFEGGSDSGGRQWQVVLTPNGFIDKEKAKLTPYGWLVAHLGYTGSVTARQFIGACSGPREARCMAFLSFGSATPDDVRFYHSLTVDAAQARSSVVGLAAANFFAPGPEFLDRAANRLYALSGGERPDEARAKSFAQSWNSAGIVRPGERLRDSTDMNDFLSFTESTIFCRSPIEIPLSASKGDILAARGHIVLECTDPAIVAELNRLRASAKPSEGTSMPEEGLTLRTIPWRVTRIESDMKPVRMEMRQIPTPEGGPPGPQR